MKSDLFKILLIAIIVGSPIAAAHAVTEAGEIQRKESKEPKSNMYVSTILRILILLPNRITILQWMNRLNSAPKK